MRQLLLPLFLLSAACGFHPRDRGQPQQIAQDRSGAALTFGHIEQVEGTRFFTIPIVRIEQGGSGSFSKYAGSDERNRLIVDSITGDSRRVLPDANSSIVNWIEPKVEITTTNEMATVDSPAGGADSRPSGIYAAVVKRPGREKEPATYDLMFGRFEDGTQVWAAKGLSGVEAVWLTPDKKLAVVAANTKGAIYRLYDPASFQQVLEKRLAL